jgi:phage terminase large subunit-like protein
VITALTLAKLPEADRLALLSTLSGGEAEALQYSFEFWRQTHQTPPEPPWRVWALIAGRGAGKSWTGAQWVRHQIETGRRRCIALVAPTHLAGRKVMIEDGLLRLCPPWNMPTYEMATSVVRWSNGAVCHLLSSETPDRARGFNFDGAWCDEVGAFDHADEMWDQLSFATRLPGPLGDSPAIVVTTTPRSTRLVRRILADPGTVITRATTFDNRAHLDPEVLRHLEARYASTRLGRQELLGELLTDTEGALWQQSLIDSSRVDTAPATLKRVVIGVDPSGGGSASTGIVAVGIGLNGHLYVVGDHSVKGSPQAWGAAVSRAYHSHKANKVVVEKNFGGDMCISVLKSVDPSLPITTVTASRGKQLRAEPVVSLYEQARVHHCGVFPLLEDEMTSWDPAANDPSPDRLDALVWAATELSGRAPMRITQAALRTLAGPDFVPWV